MKARMVCLCALICFLSMSVCVWGQSPEETVQSKESVINLGLADVNEIYVRIVADSVNEQKLEDQINSRLSQSGLKVMPTDVNAMNDQQKQKLAEVLKRRGGPTRNLRVYLSGIPELIVRISVLQGTESGPCVYHVQTSFAREVYLRSPRSSMKAEVWRIDVPIGIADADECDSAVRTSAMGQVDAFIADWKKANTVKTSVDIGEQKGDMTVSAAQRPNEKAAQQVDYEYVASKNSKVFHKKDCRAAARISSENLVGFKTRDEAIQSGRRPCKICNP
jgi:hypothetical protein